MLIVSGLQHLYKAFKCKGILVEYRNKILILLNNFQAKNDSKRNQTSIFKIF
ncbi:hypothetical protein SAMN06265348_102393 [Pedobacter westerhofensis]|uniref:Uncharacterized protein n=1 Tax=Pedobacter westerhofensis TaxID=425512 RepID=A0A521BKZ3_9SPHI|nr:hypothetical protein SAMN06265348_102393 [Pedobacter westerhofensis]